MPSSIQEVFLTPGYLAVATEYADGGSLADFQRRIEHASGMTEVPARALFQQMAVALDFCHRRGVTLGGFGLDAWLLDRAPARPAVRRQTTGGCPDVALACCVTKSSVDHSGASIYACSGRSVPAALCWDNCP